MFGQSEPAGGRSLQRCSRPACFFSLRSCLSKSMCIRARRLRRTGKVSLSLLRNPLLIAPIAVCSSGCGDRYPATLGAALLRCSAARRHLVLWFASDCSSRRSALSDGDAGVHCGARPTEAACTARRYRLFAFYVFEDAEHFGPAAVLERAADRIGTFHHRQTLRARSRRDIGRDPTLARLFRRDCSLLVAWLA